MSKPTDRTISNAEGEEETIRYCGTVDARDAKPTDYSRLPGWSPEPVGPRGAEPDLEDCERRLFRHGIGTTEGKRFADRLALCIIARLPENWGPEDIIDGRMEV